MFFKRAVLRNFANYSGQHVCWSLLLIKKTPTQVFSFEICEIFKNTFFYRTPPVNASVLLNTALQ